MKKATANFLKLAGTTAAAILGCKVCDALISSKKHDYDDEDLDDELNTEPESYELDPIATADNDATDTEET